MTYNPNQLNTEELKNAALLKESLKAISLTLQQILNHQRLITGVESEEGEIY